MLLGSEYIHRVLAKFNRCAPLFIALGDEIRQKLILDIADAGREGINVTDLSAKTHLSRPAISHHLKVLKDASIIYPDKKGTQIFYKLNLKDNLKEIEQLVTSMQGVLQKIDEAEAAAE